VFEAEEEVEASTSLEAVVGFKMTEPKVQSPPGMTHFFRKIAAGIRIRVVDNCAFLMDYSVKKD
jgi:hypothetical protein